MRISIRRSGLCEFYNRFEGLIWLFAVGITMICFARRSDLDQLRNQLDVAGAKNWDVVDQIATAELRLRREEFCIARYRDVQSAQSKPRGRCVFQLQSTLPTPRWLTEYAPHHVNFTGYKYFESPILFLDDSKRVLVGDYGNSFKEFDVATGKEIRTVQSQWIVSHLFSCSNETRVLSPSDDGEFDLYDAASFVTVAKVKNVSIHLASSNEISFSPNRTRLATRLRDPASQSALPAFGVFDTSNGRLIWKHADASQQSIRFAIFLDEKRFILWTGNLYEMKFETWDISTGKQLSVHDFLKSGNPRNDHLYPVGIHRAARNGELSLLLCGDPTPGLIRDLRESTYYIWDYDLLAGKQGKTIEHLGLFDSAKLLPDGQTLVIRNPNGTIDALDLRDQSIVARIPIPSRDSRVVVSNDGLLAIISSKKGEPKLYDVLTGRDLLADFQGHVGSFLPMTFSPDNRFLVSYGKDTLKIWKLDLPDFFTSPSARKIK